MAAESTIKPVVGLCSRSSESGASYCLSADYSQAVAEAGGIPIQIPLIPSTTDEAAGLMDAIVLCGSPSDVEPALYGKARHPEVKLVEPGLDDTGRSLLRHAFQNQKPVLAICYGMQLLNVFLQGTLLQHIPNRVPAALSHNDPAVRHELLIEKGSRMAQWIGNSRVITVNSTHHQAVETLGVGLLVAARSPDGIIEAVEGVFPDHFVLGVQWHPERIRQSEPLSGRIFAEFIHAARQAAARKGIGTEKHLVM